MSRHCLWRPFGRTSHGEVGSIPAQTREKEREFDKIRRTSLEKILEYDGADTSLTIIEPPWRSLVEFMNSSLVIGQEVALTTFLLAAHRVAVGEESMRQENDSGRKALPVGDYLDRESSVAMVLVYATLLIIVYYNQKALNHQSRTVTGQRRKKAMVRMTDAILLAAILRLTSGIIQTLTAAYSSDTVYALSISGMSFHLLTCDYKYANGVAHGGDWNISSLHTFAHPRPAFLGGTIALNAVFFSTALLVSRIESNASSYAFVSLAVTLFAFYPATRHNIARIYPNTVCKYKQALARMYCFCISSDW